MFYVTVFSIYYVQVVAYVEKHFITFLTERKYHRRERISWTPARCARVDMGEMFPMQLYG